MNYKFISYNIMCTILYYLLKWGGKMEITLLSTVYKKDTLIKLIEELGPKHLILLSEDINSKEMLDCINEVVNTFGRFIQIRKKSIGSDDLVENASLISEFIKSEKEKLERSIIVSIDTNSEQNLGLLYGAISRHDDVDRIVCYSPKNGILDLPILAYKLSKPKRDLLSYILNGEDSAENLASLMGLSKGMIYHYVRELRNNGLLDKNSLKITTAGKLAII